MKALVTGASGGIGRAFATTLAANGYAVTAVARREDKLHELMAELGPGHDYLVADLATPEGLLATAELVRESQYTLLVNNAGTATHGDFSTTSLDAALVTLDLNCRAVITLAHAFLTEAESGSTLVNVSSTMGLTPKPGMSVYSASKAFVESFSAALWYEQRARGVQVLALLPGVTVTESQAAEDVPKWLVQTPQQVVDRTLAAVARRSGPTVLTSRANTLFTNIIRLLPRRAGLAIMA